MKQAIESTTTKQERSAKIACGQLESVGKGMMVVLTNQTTTEKQKSAAKRILSNMPPLVKPGEKPAHVLLSEYRNGK